MRTNQMGYLIDHSIPLRLAIQGYYDQRELAEKLTAKVKENEVALLNALKNENYMAANQLSDRYHDQIKALYDLGYNLLVFVPGEADGIPYLHLNLYKIDENAPFQRQEDPYLENDDIHNSIQILATRLVIAEKTAPWDSARRQMEADEPRQWPQYLIANGQVTIHNVLELEGENWFPHIHDRNV